MGVSGSGQHVVGSSGLFPDPKWRNGLPLVSLKNLQKGYQLQNGHIPLDWGWRGHLHVHSIPVHIYIYSCISIFLSVYIYMLVCISIHMYEVYTRTPTARLPVSLEMGRCSRRSCSSTTCALACAGVWTGSSSSKARVWMQDFGLDAFQSCLPLVCALTQRPILLFNRLENYYGTSNAMKHTYIGCSFVGSNPFGLVPCSPRTPFGAASQL